MILDTRQTIYKGVAFVFTSFVGIEKRANLKFQNALLERGLDFTATQDSENRLIVIRDKPTVLEIRIELPGPGLGQLAIIGAHGTHHGDLFEREAEAVVQAFNDTWYEASRQILNAEVTLRDLFESSYEHAFQELWMHRLHQPEEALSALGRPVLGGGIRFVMPPLDNEQPPCNIDVKIESYLRDTKKIFVEAQFGWPAPTESGTPMDAPEKLTIADKYVDENVIPFILGG